MHTEPSTRESGPSSPIPSNLPNPEKLWSKKRPLTSKTVQNRSEFGPKRSPSVLVLRRYPAQNTQYIWRITTNNHQLLYLLPSPPSSTCPLRLHLPPPPPRPHTRPVHRFSFPAFPVPSL